MRLWGEVQVVTWRTEVGAPWNALTGDRTLYRASLDTERGMLIIEKFKTNTSLNPKTLEWKREYPIHSPEELRVAEAEMARLELSYPLEPFYRLHAQDCHALFFYIPTGNMMELAGQAMQIVSRLEASLTDYSIKRLIRFNTKCGMPPFYLGAVLSTDHRLKKFAIVSENGKPLPMRVEQVGGQLLIKNGNKTLVRISGQETFDPVSGGRFSASVITDCEKEIYKTYDFEISRIVQHGNYVWLLASFQELDGHISLSNDRDPEFDIGQAMAQAPVDLVTGVLDGIFGTLIWNIFVSNTKKKELIEKSIFEEAKKNETMRDNFTDDELRNIAHRIASNSSVRWFAPFSGTGDIKKRAAMEFSFELVKKIALEKLPDGSLPDMANGVAIRVTRDLEQCLRATDSSSGIDVCVAKFARSAPYRVGRELLILHMEAGLRDQALNKDQKKAVLATSLRRFDQCSQANYFKIYDEHIKKLASERRKSKKHQKADERRRIQRGLVDDDLPFNSNNVIMSCLFQGIMDGVDEATILGVSETLRPVMGDENARRIKSDALVSEMRQCFIREGYFVQAENFRQYNHAHLQTLEVDQFQNKVNSCLSATKIKTAETLIERQVATNDALILATAHAPELRQQVVSLTINEGIKPCLAVQKGIPDPAKCATMAQNVATRESFILILQNNLATEMGRDTPAYNWALREVGLGTMEPRPYSFNLRKCFDDRRAALLKSLEKDNYTIPTDDFSNANCITRAILELAPEMVRQKYLKTIKEKPDLKDIAALRDPAMLAEMGQKMKQCLLLELRGHDTVDALSAALEGAQNRCTVALYKDILPHVIELAMQQKLLNIIPNQARRAELVARLKADFTARLSGLDNEAAIMAMIDSFTADATMETVKQSLRWSVADNLPGDEQKQKELSDQIIAQVVTPDWERQMREAMKNNDTPAQNKLQNQLKKDAAPLIMERALPERLREHIKTQAGRNAISRTVVQEYRKCLGKIKNDAKDFDKKFDQCASDATNRATRAIFEASLEVALDQYFPTNTGNAAEKASNREAQRQIKAHLLTSGLSIEIAKANQQGAQAVARLGDIFKVRAGGEVAKIMVERELYRSLSGDIRDRVVPRAKSNAQACFRDIEDRLARRESLNVQRAMDSCSKKIKVETASMALMESLGENLGLLSNQPAKATPVIEDARLFFERCVAGYSSWSEEQMSTKVDECISKTVVHFSDGLAQATVDYLSPIRSGEAKAMPAFRTCLASISSQIDRGTTWVKSEVEKCVSTVLKPNLILEVRNFYNTKIPGGISSGERAVVEDGFTILMPIFDGKITPSAASSGDPILGLRDTFGQLASFLRDSAKFDQVTTQRRITSFKVHVRGKLASSATLTDKQFIEELVQSDLMTTMIEGYIAEKIISAADSIGMGETTRKRVVSPGNMQNFFERDPIGVSIMDAIKREVVRPILAGVPMSTVMASVKAKIMAEIDRRIDEIIRKISPF